MSRNIGDTYCRICGAPNEMIVLDEEPRQCTVAEVHSQDYLGLVVAAAHCTSCDAKYLAWVDAGSNPRLNSGHWKRWGESDDRRFVDMSFRSSFNDEPAPEDLPTPERLRQIHRDDCYREYELHLANAEAHMTQADAARKRADQPSQWELYRR